MKSMISKKPNMKKFERMCILAFSNALRLHSDSVLLFKHKSYASAYAISILALEETGKYHLLANFVWHASGLLAKFCNELIQEYC
jgi:AbiV family abortive infection protein